jgi:hypothetical protein
MAWVIICLLIVCPIIYLLTAPFYLEIDSTSGLIQFRFHHILKARLILNENVPIIDFNSLVWRKEIRLLSKNRNPGLMKIDKREKPKSKNKIITLSKLKSILQSFRINKLLLTIDTGEMQLNGILYPLFLLVANETGENISINFSGQNKLILQIENNLYRIIRAFIKS